jgi:hypothetical protein
VHILSGFITQSIARLIYLIKAPRVPLFYTLNAFCTSHLYFSNVILILIPYCPLSQHIRSLKHDRLTPRGDPFGYTAYASVSHLCLRHSIVALNVRCNLSNFLQSYINLAEHSSLCGVSIPEGDCRRNKVTFHARTPNTLKCYYALISLTYYILPRYRTILDVSSTYHTTQHWNSVAHLHQTI